MPGDWLGRTPAGQQAGTVSPFPCPCRFALCTSPLPHCLAISAAAQAARLSPRRRPVDEPRVVSSAATKVARLIPCTQNCATGTRHQGTPCLQFSRGDGRWTDPVRRARRNRQQATVRPERCPPFRPFSICLSLALARTEDKHRVCRSKQRCFLPHSLSAPWLDSFVIHLVLPPHADPPPSARP